MILRGIRFLPFRSFSSDTAKNFIEKTVKENNVVVFMKGTPDRPMCGFSRAVCQILNYHRVNNLAAVNVLEDEDVRSGIKSYTSWPTIPQVFIKGKFIGGCDIMMEMHQNGELEKLLVKENVVDQIEDSPESDDKKD